MPALTKTWTQPLTATPFARAGGSLNHTKGALLLLKNALISGLTPWTVLASSNRTVANTSDNWSSESDIARGANDTNAGSWVLLRSPSTVHGFFYLYIEFTSISDYRISISVTKELPDLSSLSPYRGVELTGAVCTLDAITFLSTAGSGHYMTTLTVVMADDGSFILTCGGEVVSASEWAKVGEYTLVFFNVLDDTKTQDPYPFVLFGSDGSTQILHTVMNVGWRNGYSLAPDGTQVAVRLIYPSFWKGVYIEEMPDRCVDMMHNGGRPFAWPMRVVCTETGYETEKGTLSDMWWGAPYIQKWGRPGYDGLSIAAAQKGVLWMPCLEPFFW